MDANNVDVDGDGKAGTWEDRRAWKTGVEFLLRNVRERYPSMIITGNSGWPFEGNSTFYQFVNGCMHENALGNVMGSGRWDSFWGGLERTVVHRGREPFYFAQVDMQHNRTQQEARVATSMNDDDFRRLRLGLCSTMLRDHAYFGFDRGDCIHKELWWFDEYDADVGTPTGEAEEDVWGAGTWLRRFENGWVVVNASDKPITVSLPWEATDASTKQRRQSFVIPPLDGRILTK